jgi:glucose-1-phosphate cytidylyltransferase
MQTVILCGGKGTRMKEETEFRPKPMVEVGGYPILWHIMQIYMAYGHKDFIIALGYKGNMIKDFFLNWRTYVNDFTINMRTGRKEIYGNNHSDFRITFVDTGDETLTGGRVLRCEPYIEGKEFMLTFGDGVSNLDINKLLKFHREKDKAGTVSGIHTVSRFGLIDVNKKTGIIKKIREKPVLREYISGGFMVFKREALDYFTKGALEEATARLAKEGQLAMYAHDGFWRAVDTYNELEQLNQIWKNERPWAVWENKKRGRPKKK